MLNVISGLLAGGAPPVSPTSYESIATVNVGSGGATSIEFTSIPSTYKHLQLRAFVMSSAVDGYMDLRFNGDTTSSNYRYHYMLGSGSGVSANTAANAAYLPGTGGTNGTAVIADILDYQNSNKYKTIRVLDGWDSNGTGYIMFNSNLWMSTSAITSIKLTNTGMTPQQYSSFALYGIKG